MMTSLSLTELAKLITTPELLKQLFGNIADWFTTKKAETPIQVRNQSKVIAVLCGEHKKLAKNRAETRGLREFVADWLGVKKLPNRAFWMAAALDELTEAQFDSAETGLTGKLGLVKTHLFASRSEKQRALDALKKHLLAGKRDDFQAVFDRVQAGKDGAYRFLTEAEHAEHVKSAERAASVTALSKCSMEVVAATVAAQLATFDMKTASPATIAAMNALCNATTAKLPPTPSGTPSGARALTPDETAKLPEVAFFGGAANIVKLPVRAAA